MRGSLGGTVRVRGGGANEDSAKNQFRSRTPCPAWRRVAASVGVQGLPVAAGPPGVQTLERVWAAARGSSPGSGPRRVTYRWAQTGRGAVAEHIGACTVSVMWHIDTRRPNAKRERSRGPVPFRAEAAKRGVWIGLAWGGANVCHQLAIRWWASKANATELEPLARTAALTATGTLSLIFGLVAAAATAYVVWPWSRTRVRDECGSTVALGVLAAWATTWLATLLWRVIVYFQSSDATEGFANPVTLPLLIYPLVGAVVFAGAFYARKP